MREPLYHLLAPTYVSPTDERLLEQLLHGWHDDAFGQPIVPLGRRTRGVCRGSAAMR